MLTIFYRWGHFRLSYRNVFICCMKRVETRGNIYHNNYHFFCLLMFENTRKYIEALEFPMKKRCTN